MGDFDALFDQIMHAKPVGNFLPRLPVGRHHLAIKRYNGKQSEMGQGVILEADFVVMQSSTLKQGELRGWAWFPHSPGLAGQYESARVMEYLSAVGAGVGDQSPAKVVGGRLVDGTYVGVQIIADVTPSLEKDGVTPKLSKKTRQPMFNISWTAVPGQTQETVAQTRQFMQTIQPPAEPVAAAAPANSTGQWGAAQSP